MTTRTDHGGSDDLHHEREHYESIPWDALVTHDARRRRLWLVLVGAGVVVAAVAFVLTHTLLGPRPAVVTTPSSSVVDRETATTTTGTVVPAPAAAGASEGAPGPPEAEVAALAAWFVTDYFTADGSEAPHRAVEERLPDGVALPAVDPAVRSFVESALPLSVEPVEGDRYRVVVVVRYLVARDGESYRRPEPKAAEVIVEATGSGLGIADLPAPVPLPESAPVELRVGSEPEIPEHIADAAIAEAGAWGSPTGEVTAGRVGGRWRAVAIVVDEAGLRLPVSIWLDEDGSRL